MNHSQRFRAIFNGEGVDRIPLYFFGTWRETKIRWKKEGLDTISTFNGDAGPQVPGMDPDWEEGMWDCHGLVNVNPIGNLEHKVIQETEDHVIYRNSIGDIVMDSKKGSTVAHILNTALSLPGNRGRLSKNSWIRMSLPDGVRTGRRRLKSS